MADQFEGNNRGLTPGLGERTAVKDWLKRALEEEVIDAILSSGTDPLTGLLNRRGLSSEVNRVEGILKEYGHIIENVDDVTGELAKSRLSGVKSIQITAIDLSGFRMFNNQNGEPKGDELLKKFAKGLLEVYSRETDVVARWGGDETAVVSFNSELTEEAASKIKSELDNKLPQEVKTYIVCANLPPNVDVLNEIDNLMSGLTDAKKLGSVDDSGRNIGGGLVFLDSEKNNGK